MNSSLLPPAQDTVPNPGPHQAVLCHLTDWEEGGACEAGRRKVRLQSAGPAEEGAGMGGGASPTRLCPLLSPWELIPLFLSLLKGNNKVQG